MSRELFYKGQWVTFNDLDEDEYMVTYVGQIVGRVRVKGNLVYIVRLSENREQMVLEEELRPLVQED